MGWRTEEEGSCDEAGTGRPAHDQARTSTQDVSIVHGQREQVSREACSDEASLRCDAREAERRRKKKLSSGRVPGKEK